MVHKLCKQYKNYVTFLNQTSNFKKMPYMQIHNFLIYINSNLITKPYHVNVLHKKPSLLFKIF